MQNLPPELLRYILEYLPANKRAPLNRINRAFYDVENDNNYWQDKWRELQGVEQGMQLYGSAYPETTNLTPSQLRNQTLFQTDCIRRMSRQLWLFMQQPIGWPRAQTWKKQLKVLYKIAEQIANILNAGRNRYSVVADYCKHCDINAGFEPYGYTLLTFLVLLREEKLVQYLLAQGALVDGNNNVAEHGNLLALLLLTEVDTINKEHVWRMTFRIAIQLVEAGATLDAFSPLRGLPEQEQSLIHQLCEFIGLESQDEMLSFLDNTNATEEEKTLISLLLERGAKAPDWLDADEVLARKWHKKPRLDEG